MSSHLLVQQVSLIIISLIVYLFTNILNVTESKRKSPEEQTSEVKRKKTEKASDKIGITIYYSIIFYSNMSSMSISMDNFFYTY